MKHIITFLSFCSCICSFSQTNSSTKFACTDAIAQNTKGKWVNRHENVGAVSPLQKQEAYKRLDILHNILVQMYPQPKGIDIRVYRSAGIGYFGATRRYYTNRDNRLTYDYLKLLHIPSYSYFANFSPHYCAHTDQGIVFMPGNSNENSDGIGITVNDFGSLVSGPSIDDDWTINGFPVRQLSTMVTENWKHYELYGDVRGNGRLILIHRDGMLPYIPVTRKQYLDRCIVFTTLLWDKTIELAKNTPVRSLEVQEAEKKAKLAKFERDFGKDPKRLKAAVDYYHSGYKTDQQLRDERVANATRNKENELKKYTDELEKTTNEGLLNSPAVILVMYYSSPNIFETDPKKGYMLITENPDYMRRDLPNYVPQFMVFNWKWSVDFYPVHTGYNERLLQDFPVQKLQAMIDK